MDDRTRLAFEERLCYLESERINALARLNCILGGIAELKYLLEVLPKEAAPASEPAESAPFEETT